jgi:hypothetical protein
VAEVDIVRRVYASARPALRNWELAGPELAQAWREALEALETILIDDATKPDDATSQASGPGAEALGPVLLQRWQGATAEGWEAKCRVADDKDFRRQLRRAETKALSAQTSSLRLLESFLGFGCGSASHQDPEAERLVADCRRETGLGPRQCDPAALTTLLHTAALAGLSWSAAGAAELEQPVALPEGALALSEARGPYVDALARAADAMEARLGLGRIVALYYRSSTSYQIHY